MFGPMTSETTFATTNQRDSSSLSHNIWVRIILSTSAVCFIWINSSADGARKRITYGPDGARTDQFDDCKKMNDSDFLMSEGDKSLANREPFPRELRIRGFLLMKMIHLSYFT